MVSREMVGTRIRQVRTVQRKTLKDVESASGFSSTHISEIERGRTSPTIGALIQIAHALDKDPSFFIEERELEETCVTNLEDRPAMGPGLTPKGTGLHLDSLTRGILGGRLLAFELQVEPGAEGAIEGLPENSDFCLYGLDGTCEVWIGDERLPFTAGDSLHTSAEEGRLSLKGREGKGARVLMVLDPRESL